MPADGLPGDVDVVVAGSGAAGLSAALFCAIRGLSVVVCESEAVIGGTSAYSGGSIWIPDAEDRRAAGAYLDAEIGDTDPDGRREAFLAAGPAALAMLQGEGGIAFRQPPVYPDYHMAQPGASKGGRVHQPLPFDGRLLGPDFARLRRPRPGFTILGGMMVSRDEARLLLAPFSSRKAFRFTLQAVLGHLRARLSHPRGTRLLLGNALVAQLLHGLRRRAIPVFTEAPLRALVFEGRRVVGARIGLASGDRVVSARAGVVLATGGFAGNPELRERLRADPVIDRILAVESTRGDGLRAAEAVGAAVNADVRRGGHYMPVSVLRDPDGGEIIFPHVIMDRARPGLIAVDADGRRFVNEADSYHDFVVAMMERAGGADAAVHLICDDRFLAVYGLGLIKPRWRMLSRFRRRGYLHTASTLAELANRIGVDPAGLEASVGAHNAAAATGVDREWGKGSSALNRFNGDPAIGPNPCLAPIAEPPLHAVRVHPALVATAPGIATNGDARVLDRTGAPIDGLYACGADQSSLVKGTYPGPGINLGPAIVFAFRAAASLAVETMTSSREPSVLEGSP